MICSHAWRLSSAGSLLSSCLQSREVVFRLEGSDLHLWDDEAEHVVRWGRGICRAAAHRGALGVLKWLQQQDNPFVCGLDVSIFAAAGGNVDALRWLRGHHCYWDARTCEAACQGGSLPTLKWLRRNGCRWDGRSGQAAVARGDREMLAWLHQNGAPFTEGTAQTAALRGDLPTLTWLHQAGCPCDARVLVAAAEQGHIEILEWGRQHVVPPIPWTYEVAQRAVEHSQAPCLEFAIAHGCRWWPLHKVPECPCDTMLMCCWKLHAPLAPYALRRVAEKVTVTATLCLVKGAVALPAHVASDIVKLSIMSC